MIVTTSRYASRAARAAAAGFAGSRRAVYVARGKKTIRQLVEFAWRKGYGKILIVRELRGRKAAGALAAEEIEIDQWGRWKWGGSHEILGEHQD